LHDFFFIFFMNGLFAFSFAWCYLVKTRVSLNHNLHKHLECYNSQRSTCSSKRVLTATYHLQKLKIFDIWWDQLFSIFTINIQQLCSVTSSIRIVRSSYFSWRCPFVRDCGGAVVILIRGPIKIFSYFLTI
jgi:hypothetical protein